MTTSTTDTTAEPTATVSAAEREQRAQAALTQTRERVTVLGGRLDDITTELTVLDAQVRGAEQRAQSAHAQATTMPSTVSAARARLLVLADSPGEASARAEVTTAEQAQREATTGAEVAAADAARIAAEATATRKDLETERERLAAERSELSSYIEHLEREVVEARAARGDELLANALGRAQELAEAVAAAEAELTSARAALDAYRTTAVQSLQAYPAAHAAARRAQLWQRSATVAERVVASHIETMRLLEAARPETISVGNIPLWQILCANPQSVANGLLYWSPELWAARRRIAETWLAALQQQLNP